MGGGGAALQKVGSACCVIPHLYCLGLTRKKFLIKIVKPRQNPIKNNKMYFKPPFRCHN